MKIKRFNEIKLIVIAFIFGISNQSYSQNMMTDSLPETVSDTLYIIILNQNLENGRPLQNYLVLKDLSVFKKGIVQGMSKKDFLCCLFKTAILFDEPFFTLTKNIELWKFNNFKDKKHYLKVESHKIRQLNKRYTKNCKINLRDGFVNIQIAKIAAQFWVINGTLPTLYAYSDSYPLSEDCYPKTYKLNLKSINKIYKLRLKDLNLSH